MRLIFGKVKMKERKDTAKIPDGSDFSFCPFPKPLYT